MIYHLSRSFMDGGCGLALEEVTPWGLEPIQRKVFHSVDLYQVLSLMIAFGMLIATIMSDKHNEK
ncbi:putative holin-like toxin [Schleiferilactobacillus shenzhenensis]